MAPANLIFLHIPKTAGTTLHMVIGRNYPARKCCTINAIRWPEKLENLDGLKKENISMLKGHVPFGAHEYMRPGTFEYFTLLREPIDRTVSHYYQVLRSKTHHFADEMAEKKYTLAELMESGRLLYVDNLQVRMLSGDLRIPYGTVNESTLEKAISNLENYFPVVGLQNHFDSFLLRLGERYEWKQLWYRRHRVAGNRVKASQLDDKTREAVERYNRFDLLLYERVKAQTELQLANAGDDFHERLAKFKKRNERISGLINAIPFFPKPKG